MRHKKDEINSRLLTKTIDNKKMIVLNFRGPQKLDARNACRFTESFHSWTNPTITTLTRLFIG